jgi:aminoglycoside 2''-phosphotransferase
VDAAEARGVLARSSGARPAEVVAIGDGWDHDTFLVDGDLIVRFPRRDENVDGLRRELRLLPALADHLLYGIPRPSVTGEHDGRPFAGYPMIAGREVEPEDLEDEALRASLADAIRALHAFPVDTARGLLGVAGTVEEWREIYRDIRVRFDEEVAHRVPPHVARAVRSSFEAFDANVSFDPVLVHRDLGLEHVLVDTASGAVTGIIDFGDATVGDPVIDVVGVWNAAGRTVTLELARRLGYDDAAAIERMWFYAWMGSLHAAFYGLEIGDEELVADACVELARRLDQPRGLDP